MDTDGLKVGISLGILVKEGNEVGITVGKCDTDGIEVGISLGTVLKVGP